ITGYAWSGPFGFSSSLEDPQILTTDFYYPIPGTHTYVVTVTDAEGCTGTGSVQITVNDSPTVTASSDAETCANEDINLNATGVAGTGTITGYNWTGPNGFTSTDEDPVISPTDPEYPGPGTVTYFVTVTDDNGCTGTDEVSIIIRAFPSAIASASAALCNDFPLALSGTGVQGGSAAITGYNWSGPFGFSSTLEDPTINVGATEYPLPGTHTYILTVTDANGCTGVDSVTVVINAIPSVTASATSAVCNDESIALDATGVQGTGAITGYNWTGPAGFVSNIEDPTIQTTDSEYPATGTHTYFVTVTDANGCTATASVQVTVNARPNVTASAAGAICDEVAIALNATGVQGTAAISGYNWSGPNGFVSNTEDPTIQPTDSEYPGPGTHTYYVTVTDGLGCSDADSVTIQIYQNPSVVADVVAELCGNQDLVFTATGTAGSAAITGYVWTGPFGFTSNQQNPVLQTTDTEYPDPGTHTYIVTVTDANGCTASASAVVTIVAEQEIVISVDDDEICEGGMATLSVTVTGGGTINYNWQRDSSGTWVSVGQDTNVYVTPPLAVGSHTYRVEVTQNGVCTVTSGSVTVVAVPDPVITAAAENNIFCTGGFTTINTTLTGGT
ncbi:MAG: hypothetical protein R3330_09520, partial [Saprospiraceae bacterium]|nr:hypothetical protein [Saprospiraceae bacterium]